MEYACLHNHQSQFIEMFEGDKYPHEALDSIAADWFKGQSFKKDKIKESGIHSCIHYGELFTKYGPVISQVQSYTSSEPKRLSKSGDILFPASDVTPNGLARCSMLPFDDVILGGDIIILRPKEDFNSGFLSYAINNQTSQLLTRVNGGVVKHMSSKSLKSVLIPIPPMDKQEEYIGIARQADKSKFDGFKSQFLELFGNPVTNPMGWPTERIDIVAPESPSKEDLPDSTWVLNLDMIESNTGQIISKQRLNADKTLSVLPFDEGNVLFSKLRPYLNKVVLPDEKGLATTELVPLRPNPAKLSKVFFTYLLRSDQFVQFANDIAGGTKMPRMPLSELRKFQCILPPTESQLQFEFIVDQADKSKYYKLN